MSKRPNQVVVSNKEVGQRLKLLRQDRGLTQVQLAEQLEISQSNLSAIERGARGVTLNQVVRIARGLDASLDEILLDGKPSEAGQRPSRRLMGRLRQVAELNDSDQRILLQLIEGMLMRREERRRKTSAAREKRNTKSELRRPA